MNGNDILKECQSLVLMIIEGLFLWSIELGDFTHRRDTNLNKSYHQEVLKKLFLPVYVQNIKISSSEK